MLLFGFTKKKKKLDNTLGKKILFVCLKYKEIINVYCVIYSLWEIQLQYLNFPAMDIIITRFCNKMEKDCLTDF
jgi:hypothetical protein